MIKMKRLRALLLTGVMTVTMACGGTVMADEGKSQDTVPEVEAEITKVLEFAEGVSVPNARFQFEITKVTEDAPDATTLLKFRRLLEKNNLNKAFFEAINRVMEKS